MKKLISLQFDTITTPGGYQPTGSDVAGYTDPIEKLISNTLVVLTAVAGIAFTLYFLLGGLTWITAGGDKSKVDTAKTMMTNGAIGLIIIVVSYAIVWIVSAALGLDVLEPGKIIQGLTFK